MTKNLGLKHLKSNISFKFIFGRMVFCASLLVLFISAVVRVSAEIPFQSIKQNFRQQWRTEENVPRFGVLSVKQTPDGYLWLGTQEGLVRYDGVRHVVFNKDNTAAIKNNVAQILFVDSRGAMWVGTMGGGLVKYHNQQFVRYETTEGLSGNFVQALAETADGTVWIGTNKGVSALFADGRIVTDAATEALAGKTVNALCVGADGTLWIGTYGDGLYSFKDNQLQQFTEADGLLSNAIWSLAADASDNLWIGTRDGISRFDRKTFTNFKTPETGAGQTVFSILSDRSARILFGTGNGGILNFSEGKFGASNEQDGLPSDNVNSLFQDREGNIWAGTLGGLARLFEPPVETLAQTEGLRGSITSAVWEEKPGRVWVGTNEGLNLFENGKFVDAPLIKAIGRTPVYAVMGDGAGDLWVGTKGKGLFRLQNNRISQLSTANGLPNNVVFSLLEDKAGNVWIGTYGGGLVKAANGKLEIFTTKTGLISDLVSALHEDGAGNLWIVTKDGISRWRDNQFENFPVGENGLPSNEIYSVWEAPANSGNIWIGTDGGGLVRYRDGVFRVLTQADGLAQDAIFGLTSDENSLWLAGSRGISRLSLNELNQRANDDSQSPLLRPLNFGIAEGMESEYCVGGSQSTVAKGGDGRLWFGTIKGVAVINPSRLASNVVAPPVLIENVLVNDQPTDLSSGLTANSSRFEFKYTGLSLKIPEKMRFRYRLEGFDADWTDAGTRRTAYYTNLPPGDYTFRVAAANNDGVWNEQGASVSFTKLPYFYQTNWFVLLCAAAFFALAYGLHRFRLQSKLARETARHRAVLDERARLSREIHDTLTQGLTSIHAQLQAATAAAANRAPHEKYVAAAAQTARESLAEARRWIKSLRSDESVFGSLAAALCRLAEQINEISDANVTCETSGKEPSLLNPEIKQNLFRIAQESVTNALKHAAAQKVQVAIEFADDALRLEISDDGRGFEVEKATTGNNSFGLRGIRERADLIGAKLEIESDSQNGTRISARLPLELAKANRNANSAFVVSHSNKAVVADLD